MIILNKKKSCLKYIFTDYATEFMYIMSEDLEYLHFPTSITALNAILNL